MESPMPVLHLSSRLSGGVLFQPLPSARQQILFHNPPSLKSSEIPIHDTTILERMQEVSSRIPENGKCGIASAPPIHSAESGMDGAVCLRETAFFSQHMRRKKSMSAFFGPRFWKNFSDSTRKTVALIPAVCYTGGAYTIPEWR